MAGLIPFNRKRSDLMNIGFDDFHNMIDDFFSDNWPFAFRRNLFNDTFKIDVQENDKEYIVEAELPGIQKNEINVSLEDNRLKIAVNKLEDKEEKSKNYIHKERRQCVMSRSIYLADSDSHGVKAKLEHGVLTVTVPKIFKPENSVSIEIE